MQQNWTDGKKSIGEVNYLGRNKGRERKVSKRGTGEEVKWGIGEKEGQKKLVESKISQSDCLTATTIWST